MACLVPEIKVSVDDEAVARAAATIRAAGRELAEAMRYAQALAVEPMVLHTPSGDLTTYLDDRNQFRHCSPDFRVPENWRQVYVEKKA